MNLLYIFVKNKAKVDRREVNVLEDNQFKEYVISTLAEIVKKQDQLQTGQEEMRSDINQLQAGQKEMRFDINQMQAGQEEMRFDINQMKPDISQMRSDISQMRSDIKQLKTDIKRIDRKVDDVLIYVEHIDTDLQKHKKAEIM
ncbi:MAG: hypothetical protein VR68_16645 [Peptococcaceae bacterium BRH_c4a]|nr:MAG: hypothetical protein VR68_16645 [Peptococcaceae bacterium BRH_c4a]